MCYHSKALQHQETYIKEAVWATEDPTIFLKVYDYFSSSVPGALCAALDVQSGSR